MGELRSLSCFAFCGETITLNSLFIANVTEKREEMTPSREYALVYQGLLNYNSKAYFSLWKIGYIYQRKKPKWIRIIITILLNIFQIYSTYVSKSNSGNLWFLLSIVICLSSYAFILQNILKRKWIRKQPSLQHTKHSVQMLFSILTFNNYFHNTVSCDKDLRYWIQSLFKKLTCVFTVWSIGLCVSVYRNLHHCFDCCYCC